MKRATTILIFLSSILTSCAQDYHYPGELEIRDYTIGSKVDTTNFKKVGDLYFPNYLDGWTMTNFNQLPEKYQGLPIAIWKSKSDSAVALTLINDIVLNITVSFLTENEKEKFSKMFIEKFGAEGKKKSYEETHPLQSWITYWNLTTWQTDEAIAQIGNSDMRKPKDPLPKDLKWNLAYSDFRIENKIIEDYKKILFSNKEDSIAYFKQKEARHNRLNPPKNGIYTDYHDNGNIREKGIYKNGKKNGVWEEWYENGQKKDSATYKNDEFIGKRLLWHDNGQLLLESYWSEQHDRIKVWTRYFENGQIESIGGFDENGEFHGKDLQFYESGKIKRETHYEHGKEISDEFWFENGKQLPK